jgi:hypothetical protein
MKQILHIFVKDTRRFWPEILVSLAITAAFVCTDPFMWLERNDPRSQMMKVLAGLLLALVPVSWWVLITRAIHGEKLVGDTQFWITRPYEWKKLIVAKALFLAVFLYLPFFLAQSTLLAEAGFHPLSSMTGLLYNLLLITGIIVLPLVALATITSSFARTTLTILGVFVSCLVLAVLASLVLGNGNNGPDGHFAARLAFALALSICGAAVVLQYCVRKVWHARAVLIALPILICAVVYLRPYSFLINRNYPIPAAQAATGKEATAQAGAPVLFEYSPETHLTGSDIQRTGWHVQIGVQIPLKESGVGEGYVVTTDGVQVEITASDGSHWSSTWQSDGGDKILPGEQHSITTFMIPIDIYKKFQSMPLSVHLRLAITQARTDKSASVIFPGGDFSVPDFGVCSPLADWNSSGPTDGAFGITCFSALRQPQLTHITTRWTDASCPASPSAAESGVASEAWVGELERKPAEFGISSVVQAPVGLSNTFWGSQDKKPDYLCPGTPINFTQYNAVSRTQASIDIQNYHLRKLTDVGGKISIEPQP